MARSFAQPGEAPCPACGQPVPFQIWLIVDTAERPDLAQRVRDGTLHTVACPNCDHHGTVDAPLLVHDPERGRVLFAPPQGTGQEEDRQIAGQLLGQVAANFTGARPAYLEQVIPVPRELLPTLLDADDPLTALEEVAAQAAEELERLRREDPEAYQELEAEAREALAGASPVLRALQAFIFAETWDASRHVVEAHPELLGDEVDALLGQLIESAQEQGDDDTLRVLEEHRALLRRCRQAGVDAAFAESGLL
jgi:hypothetical protein